MTSVFDQMKSQILSDIDTGIADYSPKGSIDEKCREIVDIINGNNSLVTTSSCSGRISCYIDKKNKGIDWIIVKHRTMRRDEILRAIKSRSELCDTSAPLVMLKCEPFILHVLCKDLDSATHLYHVAMSSGYRESGIGIGNKKTMVAIRTTSFSLELPIARGSQLLLDDRNLETVITECNIRLVGNFNRLDRLLAALKKSFAWPSFSYSGNRQLVAQRPVSVSRYGHVSFAVPFCGRSVVVSLGGSGGNPSGNGDSRNISPHIMYIDTALSPSFPSSKQMEDWVVLGDRTSGVMHSALGVIYSEQHSTIVVSGGRQAPQKPMSAILSVFRVSRSGDQSRSVTLATESLSYVEVGSVPPPRWGHTLTAFDDERLVLIGGRNASAVFADAYFLQVVSGAVARVWSDKIKYAVDGDAPQVTPMSADVCFLWTKIPAPSPLSAHPTGIFFHAACTIGKGILLVSGGLEHAALNRDFIGGAIYSADEDSASAWVLTPATLPETYVHSHLSSLENISSESECIDSAELANKICWVKVTFDEEPDNSVGEILADPMAHNRGRFGHSMTYLGGKSVVFIGGTDFDSASENVNKQSLEVWDISVTQSVECPPSVVAKRRFHVVQGAHCEGYNGLEMSRGGLRCHHQAIYDGKEKQLTVSGGGLSCGGLFGAEYCSSVVLRVGCGMDLQNDILVERSGSTSCADEMSAIVVQHRANRARKLTKSVEVPNSETLAFLVSKKRLRQTKVFLESRGWLDKSVRISPPHGIGENADDMTPLDIECVNLFHRKDAESTSCRAEMLPSSLLRHKIDDMENVMAVPVTKQFYSVVTSHALLGSAATESTHSDQCSCDVGTFNELYSLLVSDIIPPVRSRDLLPGQDIAERRAALTDQAKPILGDRRISFLFIRQFCILSKSAMASIHDILTAYLKDMIPRVVYRHTQNSSSSCGEEDLTKSLTADIPKKFEIVGNVLMISENSLRRDEWVRNYEGVESFWEGLVHCYHTRGGQLASPSKTFITRVARKAEVDLGPKRESRVRLLFPSSHPATANTSAGPDGVGWVEVVENGIRYGFDITKVMFCSGNVTERMRMATFVGLKKQEVIVDLYSGVGYYTLPFLVYAGAVTVHCCEWNPNSVTALMENLRRAGVQSFQFDSLEAAVQGLQHHCPDEEKRSCFVYQGDNAIYASTGSVLSRVADRVCLGLLPSSVGGWPLAVNVLKPNGGILHVHENVREDNISEWVDNCCETFRNLFMQHYANQLETMGSVAVECTHVEHVKSFAPRVIHIVVDIKVTWHIT